MSSKNSKLIPNFKLFVPKESADKAVKIFKASWARGDGQWGICLTEDELNVVIMVSAVSIGSTTVKYEIFGQIRTS